MKHWTFIPPGKAYTTSQNVGKHFEEKIRRLKQPNLNNYSTSCLQSPGDAIYVPIGWGHEVVNIKTSVGAALAFEQQASEEAEASVIPYHQLI